MNAKRIVLAGLAAGLVMNVLDFVNNALIFGEAWGEAYKALGLSAENLGIPAFWIAFDFVLGVVLAFLYASLRPRWGAGPRTALIAGALAWFLIHLTLASHMIDGVYPVRVLLGTGGLELISELAGALVAGRLYVESTAARADVVELARAGERQRSSA